MDKSIAHYYVASALGGLLAYPHRVEDSSEIQEKAVNLGLEAYDRTQKALHAREIAHAPEFPHAQVSDTKSDDNARPPSPDPATESPVETGDNP